MTRKTIIGENRTNAFPEFIRGIMACVEGDVVSCCASTTDVEKMKFSFDTRLFNEHIKFSLILKDSYTYSFSTEDLSFRLPDTTETEI